MKKEENFAVRLTHFKKVVSSNLDREIIFRSRNLNSCNWIFGCKVKKKPIKENVPLAFWPEVQQNKTCFPINIGGLQVRVESLILSTNAEQVCLQETAL